MSTSLMDRSILDKNVREIDFNSLNILDELRKINPKFMEVFDGLKKATDKVAWLKSYNINCPVEEALIQYALDKFAPQQLSQSEEDKVRRAMAEEAAQGIEIDSPDKEAAWDAKLLEARMKDKAHLEELRLEREKQFSGNTNTPQTVPSGVSVDEPLTNIKGLGTKSVEKLNAAGVKTISDFNALTEEQLKDIVGPLVALKFKK